MLSIFSILDCLTVKLFLDQNNKRIVLAIQSGLKSELTWALNTLTLLSFKEKEDMRKDATPLAKIPGLLDALLQVVCVFVHLSCFKFFSLWYNYSLHSRLRQIDDWRDIALSKEPIRTPRVRTLGANSLVTGFGNEYEVLGSNGTLLYPG